MLASGRQYPPTHRSSSGTPHCVKNSPSVFGRDSADSVWKTPEASCVCSGEMHGSWHSSMPPYVSPASDGVVFTPGSVISMPMPAGIVTGSPFTNTSRWAWRCTWRNSCVFGVSPASLVRYSGSEGAGHGTAPVAGSGAPGASSASTPPHPTRTSAATATTTSRVPARPQRTSLPVGAGPVVAGAHATVDASVVPTVVHPNSEFPAGRLRGLLALELVSHPQSRGVDEHQVPRSKANVLEDGLDLRPELHEVSQGVRYTRGGHRQKPRAPSRAGPSPLGRPRRAVPVCASRWNEA